MWHPRAQRVSASAHPSQEPFLLRRREFPSLLWDSAPSTRGLQELPLPHCMVQSWNVPQRLRVERGGFGEVAGHECAGLSSGLIHLVSSESEWTIRRW